MRDSAESHRRRSFSQFGEDLIVVSMLETFGLSRTQGFYVDVGAFHPYEMSNTQLFYELGWRGINIDANPKSVERFKAERPEDISLHALISSTRKNVSFHIYSVPGLSSGDAATQARTTETGRAELHACLHLETQTLASILSRCVVAGRRIDLMSIDVEGMDLEVLKSNDWTSFAPFFLVVEDNEISLLRGRSSAIFDYLEPLGYRLVSQAFITSIYVRDQILH